MNPYSLLFERLIHQQHDPTQTASLADYPTSLNALKQLEQTSFLPVSLIISNHRIPDELMIRWYVAPTPQEATILVDLTPTLTWSEYVLSLSECELDPCGSASVSRSFVMNLGAYYAQHPWLVEDNFVQENEAFLSQQLGQLIGWVLQHTDAEAIHTRLADVLYRVKSKHLQVRPRWQRIYVKCSALEQQKLQFNVNP